MASSLGDLNALPRDPLELTLSPDGEISASRRANALSTKLATVLSVSYADSEIREALRLYDERTARVETHRSQNLKALAEKEVIDSNARIVEDFGHVAEQLRRVGSLLSKLNATCDSMKLHILAAKQEATPVLDEASTLLERKHQYQRKEQLLEAFRNHFTLSDEDLNILTSSAHPLTEQFFVILKRVQQIHNDCKILLGQENQRLGLELMEQTTRYLDGGFKKLYSWIQREFKGLDLEDPRTSGSIRRALRTLSERPTLFQNCLEFFAQARDATLTESFQAALTGAGSRQAIEFSTHDPLRYVGDMLAWVHSAAVSEKEALEGLFVSDDKVGKGISTGRSSEPWARIQGTQGKINSGGESDEDEDEIFDGRKALGNLIGKNLASVCQALRHRIDLAIRNSGDAVLIYKVYNLLVFYGDIFDKLLGKETSLDETLQGLRESTLGLFEDTMEQDISTGTADFTPDVDLAVPPILHTVLEQFTDIARSRGPQMSDEELGRLFSTMLRRVLDACAEGAAHIHDVRSRNIYKANYFLSLRSSLRSIVSQVPNIRLPLDNITQELSTIRETLITAVTTTLLDDSGVNSLLQEADSRREPYERKKWFKENLADAALVLDDFLASGLMDAQDAFSRLSDKSAAKEIVADAVERFCADFDELEGIIDAADFNDLNGQATDTNDSDDAETAHSLRDLYPRTGAEVRALLS